MLLRIGVDVTPAITGGTGIARYVTEVANGIAGVATVRRFAIGRGVAPPPPGTRHVPVPLRAIDRAWRLSGAPKIERIVPDISSVHASGPLLPPSQRPLVAVVHDVAPLVHPDLHPARDVDQLRRYLDGLHRAAAVIAVSTTTADRLVGLGGVLPPLHVIPNGLTELPPPVPPPLADQAYVLAVGAPVRRKGFDHLLHAIARLDDPDVAVALVGPPGPEDESLRALATTLGLGSRYHRAGPVSLAELAGWYAAAGVLAAPSIDEGFGLPLIEALSVGTPVVATDIEAFREVSGTHSTLVPVGDVPSLAEALAEALARPGRDEAAAAHARRFSWAACARSTFEVHRQVAR